MPECDQYIAKLEIHFGDKNLSSIVNILQPKTLMFIETDRPFYKPGELVRFRLLHLQRRLQPLSHLVSPLIANLHRDIFNQIPNILRSDAFGLKAPQIQKWLSGKMSR
jgi:hypothetical protein